jgi:hypothetical protein
MKENRIIAYSLLAHINDNNIGVKNFDDVFKPLVKSALCDLNNKEIKSGESITEIKAEFDSKFGLDIPTDLLRTILKQISNELSEKGDDSFKIHNDNSYLMNSFIFSDYEDEINETKSELNEIEKLYKLHLETEGVDIDSQISIFEYIDKSRLRLSKFFANKDDKVLELDDVLQASFINSIKSNIKLFNQLRRIYLGSIISAYLTVDIGESETDLELLLDTNFILGLLDLNSIESHHTCCKIVEIAKKLSFRLSVLPYTLEETGLLIERKSKQLEGSFFQGYLDPESIFSAVVRRKLSKTKLIQIVSNLENTLNEDFGVFIVGNDTKFRNLAKYQYAAVLKFYSELRAGKGWSAHHDTTAVAYVREKRGRTKLSGNILNARCLFVTNTPYDIRTPNKKGELPDIVRAAELLNLLWLSSPQAMQLLGGTELSELGLTRLVSTTISMSLPNTRVLKELDQNFSLYSGENEITADDTLVVASMISKKKIKQPEKLSELAKSNPKEFINSVKNLAEEGRKEDKEIRERVEEFISKFSEVIKLEKESRTSQNSPAEEIHVLSEKRSNLFSIVVSVAFLSFILWSFEKLFDITYFTEFQNWTLAKGVIQLTLILGGAAIKTKNKAFWLSGFISLIIAVIMLLKQ